MSTTEQAIAIVESAFAQADIRVTELNVKRYPEETIFVVSVSSADLERAAELGNGLDTQLAGIEFDGFVTVRRALENTGPAATGRITGVHDPRVTDLVRLLQSRSRTSETQPSLSYVRDTAANLAKATAPRHHLIFGRRGAGKTALLVEAKRQVEANGELVVWMNLQPHRWSTTERITLSTMKAVTYAAQLQFSDASRAPGVHGEAARVEASIDRLLAQDAPPLAAVRRLIPDFQTFLRRFVETTGRDLFIFLDDFYFVPRPSQVELLDLLHAAVRDSRVWLKIATIRHLTRWFEPSRQAGLQRGTTQTASILTSHFRIRRRQRHSSRRSLGLMPVRPA